MLFAKAVLLRSPPPHCGCFAHNGRSALYSFVCSVSGVRALRFRIIRTCAPLNFRNIFRVAFLLSCHIFDCNGISGACLTGCPCRFCFISNSDIISQNQMFVNDFFQKIQGNFLTQLYDCVNFVSLSSAAYLIVTLLLCICKHYFDFFATIFGARILLHFLDRSCLLYDKPEWIKSSFKLMLLRDL